MEDANSNAYFMQLNLLKKAKEYMTDLQFIILNLVALHLKIYSTYRSRRNKN